MVGWDYQEMFLWIWDVSTVNAAPNSKQTFLIHKGSSLWSLLRCETILGQALKFLSVHFLLYSFDCSLLSLWYLYIAKIYIANLQRLLGRDCENDFAMWVRVVTALTKDLQLEKHSNLLEPSDCSVMLVACVFIWRQISTSSTLHVVGLHSLRNPRPENQLVRGKWAAATNLVVWSAGFCSEQT